MAATGGIAALDYATSVRVSFSIVYLVPVVVATLMVGPAAGVLLSAQTAVIWVAVETLMTDRDDTFLFDVGNALLRCLTLCFVVALLAALRRSVARAQASERHSREFLAFAAHQLRTPVATVQATAETLLLADEGSENQERLLSNLATEVSRIGRLVRSLLRVARLDQGEPFDPRPVDVVQMCHDEVGRLEHTCTQRVEIAVGSDIPSVIHCEGDAVAEALGNVLDNARRHAASVIEVIVGTDGHSVRVIVRDDGAGLPPGMEERAFERFVTMDRNGGSGLGLAVARGLVRRQGGDLSYTDGSFVMEIPLRSDGPLVQIGSWRRDSAPQLDRTSPRVPLTR
jgi:signal transduction histidine kinase